MAEVRVIKLNESVYSKNDNQADMTRRMLNDKKVFFVNIMSSPGSGKTTMLSRLINMLKDVYKRQGYDSVTLKQIRQIPGVKNVITTLFGKQAGELWLPEEIAELKKVVCDAGLGIAGIESVNVSDDIKIGTAKRDEHLSLIHI